jgi:hypothetical protein
MNEPTDLERQLAAIATHSVNQSREATPTMQGSPARSRRPMFAYSSIAIATVVVAVAVVASRGDDGTKIDTGATTTSPVAGPSAQEYAGNITVLESPEHGSQLCTRVKDSYPPQCGGADINGWDWESVDTEESANGTTWGTFYVRGTWADGVFTVTRDATGPVPVPSGRKFDFTTPCEELRTDDPDAVVPIESAPVTIDQDPEYAGAWWDSRYGVYNVAFTGHIDEHEAAIRAEYDGRLCVVQFEYSDSELLLAREQLMSVSSRPPGVVIGGTGIDTVGNRVSVDVLVGDPATEAWVRDHLPGVPHVLHAALVPIPAEEAATTPTSGPDPSTSTSTLPPGRYPSQGVDSAAAAIDTWTAAGIENYSFRWERSCFCPLTDVRITVRDGAVVSAEGDLFSAEAPTIVTLIEEVARAEREATGEHAVEWGPYGLPAHASIDWIVNAIDDESGWTITEFAIL